VTTEAKMRYDAEFQDVLRRLDEQTSSLYWRGWEECSSIEGYFHAENILWDGLHGGEVGHVSIGIDLDDPTEEPFIDHSTLAHLEDHAAVMVEEMVAEAARRAACVQGVLA